MWYTIASLFPSDFNFFPSNKPPHELIRPVPGTGELNPPVNPCRSGSSETVNQWRNPPPAGRSSAFVHFANSKKNKDHDKAVKVYKRRGGCWDSKELEQPATFKELGMDPETNGIISDLLKFVMEKESYKKVGKAWTRCYVLYEPPDTDRSSLIGAMANYLKFDIYNVDLMSLPSISELKKVLGSTRNHSLIAIRDYNLSLSFPQPKNQLTVSDLLKIIDNLFLSRGDEHIIVFTTNHKDRHDAAPVDKDMHIYTSSPRPSALSSEFSDTNHGAHLVRQDQGRSTASHSDKKRKRGTSNSERKTPSISLEVLEQHFGLTRKQAADKLKVSVSTLKRNCKQHGIKPWPNWKRNKVFTPRDQHGERNTSTLWETPSHNVQPGMDSELVGQNQEASVFRRDLMEHSIALNTENDSTIVSRPPDQYEERNTSTACEVPPHNVQIGIEGEPTGHSPACSTFQTLSPCPSARRTPAPAAEPSIPIEDRQLEVNEASFMGPTFITSSDLGRLCKDVIIVETDDILRGQGNAALGNFTIDFDMGEQTREVESREQPSPQWSPAADRGNGPANNEMEMPIRLFLAANLVEEIYHPLLNAIARAHPETFAHFNPRTPQLGSMLLRNLHDLLVPWARLRFDEFKLAMEKDMQDLSQDLVNLGFDLGWLSERGSALRAAGERVTLQPEIQSLSTLVECTRESLADLEARLAQARRQDAELAAATLNLANLDPSELVFEELAS